MRPDEDIAALICELCRQFYALGWVSGTGGGISIRGPDGIYMAPSGVQKERLSPADVYLLDRDALDACRILRAPADPSLRVSECQPLFYNAYRLRDAGASRVAAQRVPEGLSRQRPAASTRKKRGVRPALLQFRTRFAQVAIQPADRLFSHGNQTFLAALADHADHALPEV